MNCCIEGRRVLGIDGKLTNVVFSDAVEKKLSSSGGFIKASDLRFLGEASWGGLDATLIKIERIEIKFCPFCGKPKS